MKTLLVIGYVWPEPKSSAAGSRMMQLLHGFRQAGYQIHYASPAELSLHAEQLSDYGIGYSSIALNCSSFDDFITELNPDAVMFDRFMMEEQFGWRVEKTCPDALRILDTEDLHCLRGARQQAAKAGLSIEQTLKVSDEFLISDQAKREVAAIFRCDLSLMISEAEITLLKTRFHVPECILHYIPFTRPTPDSSHWKPFDQRQHFVSIGNFRHEPNWDAVRYLKETLWPAIKKALPTEHSKAELHVYGAYPPKKATQLHNEKQGFLVKGWAEDAFEVIGSARVLLAPLRFGAGLKGKLVDAAECGTPSVTTVIGAEGMYQNHQPSAIANTPDAFAEHAVKLYQQEDCWQSLQQHCAPMIEERFNLEHHTHVFIERMNDLEANVGNYRIDNFTGAMLRHHTLKSTQYMSQWIEAKNKPSAK